MKHWSNRLITGLIIGICSPALAFSIFSTFAYPEEPLMIVLNRFIRINVITHVISLSILVNLPLFFGFLGSSREHSARGVLGATMLYGLLIVILKFT